MKPVIKPDNPKFSSGPTTKFKEWSFDLLSNNLLGRSHRSIECKARLKEAIQRLKQILKIPDDYHVGILPASDTGAVETAMWTMLGYRGVDVFAWEIFGNGWVIDAVEQLKLDDLRTFVADYGELPDLSKAKSDRDIIFTWNGTTSGVKVPDADWIADDREGLTICDATSAVFAMDLPWRKLDVTTFSWQKVLGGEAQHGIMILSPRAVERLENWTPSWPIPKVFRLTKGGQFNAKIFEGVTINTPSLLCVEDLHVILNWVEKIGSLEGMIKRSMSNLNVVKDWVQRTDWIDFMALNEDHLSNTSICLCLTEPWFVDLGESDQRDVVNKMVKTLADEGVAYDINGYRSAPPSLRLWGGGTIETTDLEKLLPWIEWAYQQVKQ